MPNRRSVLCEGFELPYQLAGVSRGTPVLLAFSGGADSRALLHLLAEASKAEGFPLILAHVNHGIRGEEALRDRLFCQETAAQYGLELCLLDADVPALAAQKRKGLEETAREVRYAYFRELMESRGIPLLVTAHHADDNLETLLFRLCRGSGLQGLGGIAPVRPFASGWLVRPLLKCPRREILAFCAREGLEFVTDTTNTDTAYARNRLRAEVVPILETLFEDPQSRVAEMTASLREDEELLASLAEQFYSAQITPQGLPVQALSALAPAVRRRVLIRFASACIGVSLERVHLHALESLLKQSDPACARVALPQEYVGVCESGYLRILPRVAAEAVAFRIPLRLGITVLERSGIKVTVEKMEKDTKVHNLSTQTCIITDGCSDIIKKDF